MSSTSSNPTITPTTRDRIRKMVAMLGSPVESEAVAALHGLARTLKGAGLDFNDLSTMVAADRAVTVRAKFTDEDGPPRIPVTPADWHELTAWIIDREAWKTDAERSMVQAVHERTGSGQSPLREHVGPVYEVYTRARGP